MKLPPWLTAAIPFATPVEILAVAAIMLLMGFLLLDKIDALWVRPQGTESALVSVAPAVGKQPTAKVAVKAPVTVMVGRTKELLKLPTDVQHDDNKQVLTANQVTADPHPQTVTTVIDTATGATQTYVKEDPYPWLAVERRGEVRTSYGYKYSPVTGHAETVGRIAINYDLLRVKALTLGVTGTVDTDREAFVGVGISYKF